MKPARPEAESTVPTSTRWIGVLLLILAALAVLLIFRGQQSVDEPPGDAPRDKVAAPVRSGAVEAERQLVDQPARPAGDSEASAKARRFTIACVDSSGQPVAYAMLTTRSGGTLDLVRHKADSRGRYTGDFVATVVSVTASSPGVGEGSIAIAEADLEHENVLVLQQMATVEVTVRGPGGQPQAAVKVSVGVIGLESSAGMLPKAPVPATTDSRGRCSFMLQPRGIYSLRAKVADGQRSPARKIHPYPGETLSLTLLIGVSLVIEGHVRDDMGRAVEAAVVRCFLAEDVYQAASPIPPTVTDDEGRFSLEVPRQGLYKLVAQHKAYALEAVEACEARLLDSPAGSCDLEMHPVDFIIGRVLGADGGGRAGLSVSGEPVADGSRGYVSRGLDTLFLWDPDTGEFHGRNVGITDRNGRFKLPIKPWLAGEWRIQVLGVSGGEMLCGAAALSVPQDVMREHVVTVSSVGRPGSVVGLQVQRARGELRAFRNARRRGVWQMEWPDLSVDHSSDVPVVDVPVEVVEGAVAVRCGDAARLLVGGELLKAIASKQVQVEPTWPVSFELRRSAGAHELAQVGSGRLRALVQHESGCALPPEFLLADAEKDAGTVRLPRGAYAVVFQEGWRTITTRCFRVPDDGRIISVGP